MTRRRLLLAGAVLLALLCVAVLLGRGVFGAREGPGEIAGEELPREVVAARAGAQRAAAEKRTAPAVPDKSILFGDLHVHTTFSMDAFLLSLPLLGGAGAHPIADACDFARYCSALDFWSLNDHAESVTPRIWRESAEAIRRCNAVAGDPAAPDVVSYLGWEWTQVGATPAEHWGHRNVILRDLGEREIPARPIGAGSGRVGAELRALSLPARAALVARNLGAPRVHAFARYVGEWRDAERCPPGVPARELPADCMDSAATPAELFAKLRESESAALVIPHGTAWGFTASPLASFDTQMGAGAHAPALQPLIEVYSGHGNSEEYRAWRPLAAGAGGAVSCPAPTPDYTPLCWRAGEIVAERCRAQGASEADCAARAAEAREFAANAPERASERTVPLASGLDWRDAGQCRDCFLPAYYHRPLLSAQYLLALTSFAEPERPWRYRLGFIAASDSHSAQPGTGYKEFARREMVDGQRAGELRARARARGAAAEPLSPKELPARARPPSEVRAPRLGEMGGGPADDRIAAFLFTGGLAAVHSPGRDRGAIWDALARREVYATSGQRTLLWFDLVNAPDEIARPMGADVQMRFAPRFRVRAVGSQKQRSGCPPFAARGLPEERLARLCRGECFNPTDERHLVTRIEVVRIRPQRAPGEPVDDLIADPWRSFTCPPDPSGCTVEFADDDFAVAARDALYYVRAIEEPTPAVNGRGLASAAPEDPDDDRLGLVEERAWSSPIYVDYGTAPEAPPPAGAADAAPPPAEPERTIPPDEFDSDWSERGDLSGDVP